MKVAIISAFFLESSIPLAKHLSEEGIDVDLYALVPSKSRVTFGVNLQEIEQLKPGVLIKCGANNLIDPNIRNYIKNVDFNCLIFNSEPKIGHVKSIITAYRFSKHLVKNDYDLIHLVGDVFFLCFLLFFLKKIPLVHTLHETERHYGKTPLLVRTLLNTILKLDLHVILHSKDSYKRFLNYVKRKNGIVSKDIMQNLHTIMFGLFETYLYYGDSNIEEEELLILHYGMITKYKGIDILIEAFKHIVKVRPESKLVIAGGGDVYFSIGDTPNIELINRRLTNDEIVNLNRRATIIVCPYTSASQSGIPMVTYCFNKPIVATDTGAFNEVIEHLKTGLIVPPNDSTALAEAILILLQDNLRRLEMKENIRKLCESDTFSWKVIAQQTINVYKSAIKRGRK